MMNAKGPPPGNANAALAKRRREKLIDVPRGYHVPGWVQGRFIRGRSRYQSVEWMRREIQRLRAIQPPFGWVFWYLEQKIAALDVEIERVRA